MGMGSGPSYTMWNGYRGQFNILECSSASAVQTELRVSIYSSGGELISLEPLPIPAEGSSHLVINSIAEIENAYGILHVEPIAASLAQAQRINCVLMQYGANFFQSASSSSQQGSVVAVPLRKATTGVQSFPFNTLSPFPELSRVQNWLTVFNADAESMSYTIEQYDLNGTLLEQERVEGLRTLGRRDVFIGRNSALGLLRIVPDEESSSYGASLMRYGMKEDGETRIALELTNLSTLEESARYSLSTGGPALNWLELFNRESSAIRFSLSFFSQSGELLLSREYEIPANSVRHVNAGQVIGENAHGSFSIEYESEEEGVGLASLHYGRESTWAYLSHPSGSPIAGASAMQLYNTYLRAANWLRLLGAEGSSDEVALLEFPEIPATAQIPQLPPQGVRDLAVHEIVGSERFGYSLLGSESGLQSGSTLRVYPDSDNLPSSVTSIPPMLVADTVSSVGLVPFASGLQAPVHLTHAGDGSGRMFVVERAGVVKVIQEGNVLPDPYFDLSAQVGSEGEQGLHSIAFDPAFTSNGKLYVHYNDLDGDTVVAELQAADPLDDEIPIASLKVVLRLEQPHFWHNGGQIAFGPDGLLYIGLGDGGFSGDPMGHGQNTFTLLGSILRIAVSDGSYSIPSDNPFVASGNGAGEIYAYGFRNPWRFSFDRLTGRLFTADVGQNRLEEINLVRKGGNYGWNTMEGSLCFVDNCSTEGLELPITEYPHPEGLAVIGGFVYRGERFPGLWGTYLFADFATARIWSLQEDSRGVWHRSELFASDEGLLFSSFGEDEDGELYLIDLRGMIWALDVP